MAARPSTEGVSTRERIIETAQALIFKRGFAGTSIDEIIKDVGVTKGGFFYHFKSKAELGRVVLENYASRDVAIFHEFDRRANEASDDPLESALIFMRLFEDYIGAKPGAPNGCLFASYMYGVENFDDEVKRFISHAFQRWSEMYARRFEAILEKYTPQQPVDADALSEMIMSIIEGALVLAKSQDDSSVVVRSSAQFRQYLQLLFSPIEVGLVLEKNQTA